MNSRSLLSVNHLYLVEGIIYMHQKTELMEKPVSREKQAKQARIKKLMAELEEANKDPKFRAAARRFIKYHTGEWPNF